MSVAHSQDLAGRDLCAGTVLVLGVWRTAPPRGLTGRCLPQPRIAPASRHPSSGKADFVTSVLTEVEAAQAPGSWAGCPRGPCPTRVSASWSCAFRDAGPSAALGPVCVPAVQAPFHMGCRPSRWRSPHARGCAVSAKHPGLWAPRGTPVPSPPAALGARGPTLCWPHIGPQALRPRPPPEQGPPCFSSPRRLPWNSAPPSGEGAVAHCAGPLGTEPELLL